MARRVQGLQVAEAWQGDNLTDDLRALNVTAVDKIDNFYEWNVEQGGPIVRNKLWFFGAFRRAKYDQPIANTFYTPGERARSRSASAPARSPAPAASRASRTRR